MTPNEEGYYTREQVLEEIGRLRRQLDGHRTEVQRLNEERDELRNQLAQAANRSMSFAAVLAWWEQDRKDEEVAPTPAVTARRVEELALACVDEEEQEVLVEDLLNFLLMQCAVRDAEVGCEMGLNDALPAPETDADFAVSVDGTPGSSGEGVNSSMGQRNPGQGVNVDLSNHSAEGFQNGSIGALADGSQSVEVNVPLDDDLEQKRWNSIDGPVMEATSAPKAEGPLAEQFRPYGHNEGIDF